MKFYILDSYSKNTKVVEFSEEFFILPEVFFIEHSTYYQFSKELCQLNRLFLNTNIENVIFNNNQMIITKNDKYNWMLVSGIVSIFIEEALYNKNLRDLTYIYNFLYGIKKTENKNANVNVVRTIVESLLIPFSNVMKEHGSHLDIYTIDPHNKKIYIKIVGSCTNCVLNKLELLKNNIIDKIKSNLNEYTIIFLLPSSSSG